MRLLIFVLLGLLFAAPGEVLNQILARHNVRAFRSTMISYTVLLLIGYPIPHTTLAIPIEQRTCWTSSRQSFVPSSVGRRNSC
jgi:hypothetical protein